MHPRKGLLLFTLPVLGGTLYLAQARSHQSPALDYFDGIPKTTTQLATMLLPRDTNEGAHETYPLGDHRMATVRSVDGERPNARLEIQYIDSFNRKFIFQSQKVSYNTLDQMFIPQSSGAQIKLTRGDMGNNYGLYQTHFMSLIVETIDAKKAFLKNLPDALSGTTAPAE